MERDSYLESGRPVGSASNKSKAAQYSNLAFTEPNVSTAQYIGTVYGALFAAWAPRLAWFDRSQ